MVVAERIEVIIPEPHPAQCSLVDFQTRFAIAVCSRQSGKTIGAGILACEEFMAGGIVRYYAPSSEQTDVFWRECKATLAPLIDRGLATANETRHIIALVDDPDVRIVAQTGRNYDMRRGDKATLVIMDEWQLQNEELWTSVALPMLTTTGGRAVFILTPPSIYSRHRSLASDRWHAKKMWERVKDDPDWTRATWTHEANPYADAAIIRAARSEMGPVRFAIEYQAKFIDEMPNALFKRRWFKQGAVKPKLTAVAVDPSGTKTGNECGIVVVTTDGWEFALTKDATEHLSPREWGRAALDLAKVHDADFIVGETNFGGDMVEVTLEAVAEPGETYEFVPVSASRGKMQRAEPVAALYEQGRVYHDGNLSELEDEMAMCTPQLLAESDYSPNRMDAAVWGITQLLDEIGGVMSDEPEAFVL